MLVPCIGMIIAFHKKKSLSETYLVFSMSDKCICTDLFHFSEVIW